MDSAVSKGAADIMRAVEINILVFKCFVHNVFHISFPPSSKYHSIK